jgi:hypothetical protein
MSFTTALFAASTLFQVGGQIRTANAQASAFSFNAALGKQKAQQIQISRDEERQQDLRTKKRFLQAQLSGFVGAGVRATGSVFTVIGDTAEILERNILVKDRNARIDILNALSGSALNEFQSGETSTAGAIGAATTLLAQTSDFVLSRNRGIVTV